MSKRVVMLLALVAMLSVTLMIPSSPANASQPLQMSAVALDACDVDFNANGEVDVDDIMEVASRWRSTNPAEINLYDLDDDGDIDVVDIMLVAAQWGNLCLGFGIDMGGLDTDPSMRDLAAAAGFRWVRRFVSWDEIEPSPPVGDVHNYNWPDSLFDVYRNDRRLIPLVVVAAPNPSWAVAVPDDLERRCGPIKDEHLVNGNFYDFVFNLVSRYADVTPYWVFYNEQDHWPHLTGDPNAGGCWGGHGAKYAQMLAVAWDAAHSANPHAQVIFGSVAYEPKLDITTHLWDEFFFQDAFSYMDGQPDDYVDIVMANQYNFRRDDWDGGASTLPENQEIIAKFLRAIGDTNPSFDVEEPYSVAKWQSKYGLNKPMATGETGLHVGGSGTPEDPDTNDLQARHVVHVNVRGMAAGLKFITWYTLVDKPADKDKYKNGLLQSNLTPRPAYYAYQVLTQQLDGYEFDQQLVVADKPNIQAYRFDKDGAKKLVLWRDSGERIKWQDNSATETMTVSAAELGTWTGQVRVTNKLGDPEIFTGDPSVSLTFSSDPIYVEAVQ